MANDDGAGLEALADAILSVGVSPNEFDRNYEAANVVDGLFAIARAVGRLATAVERLGVNDADTRKGALELVAEEIHGLALSVDLLRKD